MKNHPVIPISNFSKSTSFAIDPQRINIIDSLYPGYIEVHLLNYSYNDRITYPGGTGLTLAGAVEHIVDGGRLYGRLALIAGIAEVFAVHSNYDSVVVLRPLTTGLGVRWQLYRAALALTASGKAGRIKAKLNALAAKHLAACSNYVARITGSSFFEAGESYYLRECTKSEGFPEQHLRETQLPQAVTMEDAKAIQRKRIAMLRLQGWKCGEESSPFGTLTRENERTVAWLCKRGSATKWITLEYGVARVAEEKGESFKCFTEEEITQMWNNWERFNGFSGETCTQCHADANLLALGGMGGWSCSTCGHFNFHPDSEPKAAHEHPDFGPNGETIRAGATKSKKGQEVKAN